MKKDAKKEMNTKKLKKKLSHWRIHWRRQNFEKAKFNLGSGFKSNHPIKSKSLNYFVGKILSSL